MRKLFIRKEKKVSFYSILALSVFWFILIHMYCVFTGRTARLFDDTHADWGPSLKFVAETANRSSLVPNNKYVEFSVCHRHMQVEHHLEQRIHYHLKKHVQDPGMQHKKWWVSKTPF